MTILIVSRHESTINLLSNIIKESYGTKIRIEIKKSIQNPSELEGYSIILGNIPLSLLVKSKWTNYINVSLVLPPELRGKELDEKELIKYGNYIWFQQKRKGYWKIRETDVLENLKIGLQLYGLELFLSEC